MKTNATFLTMFLICFFSYSCKKQNVQQTEFRNSLVETTLTGTSAYSFNAASWTSGLLYAGSDPTQQVLPNTELLPIHPTKGGNKIFKCNNPEIFTGTGWLMQNSRVDATLGGQSYPLNGNNTVYLFHLNQSGSTKYIHLLVTNPNATAITVANKGSYYTNTEKPLTGIATGQSYFVAKDWLNNTLRQPQTENISLNQYQATEIFKTQVNTSSMVDARFEIQTSGNAYYYTVVTNTGVLTDAINASQGSPAAGSYYTESANAYGREAGVYATSELTADNDVYIPNQPAHIGFALNTTNKFAATLEDQTSAKIFSLTGASSKTYGNYGHKYSMAFHLYNNNSGNKTVKLYFGSNSVNAAQSNATWNGAIKLNGSLINVYTQLNAPRQQLSTWTIAPGLFNATIEFYVPGLITANQQLIFEVN